MIAFKKLFNLFQSDARNFQITFLGLFLLNGIFNLHWDIEWQNCFLVVIACLAFQFIGLSTYQLPINSLKSALISALGLCLLLRTQSIWVMLLACLLAIYSKFIIRYKGKHLFNPVNFALVIVVAFSGQAWVSPGQWGNNVLLVFGISACGLMVLLKAGRVGTGLAFLITFAGLEFLRSVIYKGWPLDFWWHQMSNGALLLFSFFMITDPRTSPDAPRSRVIWAVTVAIISFILTEWVYVFTAPIWALFIISPTTILLDTIWKGKRFVWQPIRTKTAI